VLVTSTGFAFSSDVGGNLYAFDAATGHQYWKDETGSSIVAPISAYSVNGTEYLAVVVGEAGNQQTPNLPATEGSRIVAYSIGRAATIANSSTGQVALAKGSLGPGSESEGPAQRSSGSAPYAKQQVAQGGEIYGKDCAV
jgi:outer membrane protein assembly factor BamB